MRQPTLYLPHGGGPWPWMPDGAFGPPGMYDRLRTHLAGLPATLPAPPRALLVVSAHWEAPVATLATAANPGMLYDYSGFPPETYRVRWPAPGAPELAPEVERLLAAAGVPTARAPDRGFDHGTFVPLSQAWPEASVPTLQLSLVAGLDPAVHLAIGRALAPLRDRGVLLVGSGMSYHNMRGFFGKVPSVAADSQAFDHWLAETVSASGADRAARLRAWADAPGGRRSHPREEHLLPLMVAAGAADHDEGTVVFRDVLMRATVSSVRFG